MMHKRYKVVTTIYNNIIVLFIVQAMQKTFCVHFVFIFISQVFLGFWFAGLNI